MTFAMAGESAEGKGKLPSRGWRSSEKQHSEFCEFHSSMTLESQSFRTENPNEERHKYHLGVHRQSPLST